MGRSRAVWRKNTLRCIYKHNPKRYPKHYRKLEIQTTVLNFRNGKLIEIGSEKMGGLSGIQGKEKCIDNICTCWRKARLLYYKQAQDDCESSRHINERRKWMGIRLIDCPKFCLSFFLSKRQMCSWFIAVAVSYLKKIALPSCTADFFGSPYKSCVGDHRLPVHH